MEGLKRVIKGTHMIKMIHWINISKDRKVTYARFVCNHRHQKEEANSCRIIVCVDIVEYQYDVYTKT